MLFQILQTDKRFGTSQFVEIVIVIIVVISVMSLKEGFNRVVRRGVGEVEACGRISSFPLPTSSSQPAVSSCTIQSTVAGLALQCIHCTHFTEVCLRPTGCTAKPLHSSVLHYCISVQLCKFSIAWHGTHRNMQCVKLCKYESE